MARSLIRITTAMVLVFCTFTLVQVRAIENFIVLTDPCRNFLCQNDGTCTAPADVPYCKCLPGFSGTRCEIVDDDFPDHPGTCPPVEPGDLEICGGVICDCDDECDEDEKCCDSACGSKMCTKVAVVLTDPCRNFLCQNDGTCTAPADVPYCKCLPGFSGTRCEIVDDDFPDHPGTCPPVEPGDLEICVGVICDCDDECDEDEKCCDSACGSKMCTKLEHQLQLSCATVRCNAETTCRMVLICEDDDCQLGPRCISTALLGPARDNVCRRHGYLEVLLVLDDSSIAGYPRYNQLTCKGPSATRDCPNGYVCVDDVAGGSACCTGKPDPTIEKPGTCPTGSLSVCGGTFCEVDNNCPGEQKCCRREGCGNLCTDPDSGLIDGCTNKECPRGQTCVYRTPKCPPGMACIQAFIPMCVPDGCVNCDFNEICQEVLPNKFRCVPEPKDLCGGCAIGEVCIDTGKRCFTPPCDGVYQCVRDNECGGCREGEVCIDTGKRCIAPPCDGVYQCVRDNECGGCREGEVCIDTGKRCIAQPCDGVYQCVPDNECGGCPPRQRCEEVYPPCPQPPDCDALRAINPEAQCIIPDCKPVHICVDDNSPDPNPEPEPSLCPLRCAYNQKCEYVASPCLLDLGRTCYRPQCVPIVPVPAPCPKPKGLLSVVQCILHKLLFPVCQSDRDCRGSSQRCCVADCGRKSCVAAP